MKKFRVPAWLAGIAIAICILSCTDPLVREKTKDECMNETCLTPKIMDLSVSDAQRYFYVSRAIANGFDVKDASRRFRQMYATLASFLGMYDQASEIYPLREQNEDPAALGYLNATPANPTILALSRGKRAVFVNEAHASAQTRAAIYTLLRPLRDAGYGYLAIEGLSAMPSAAGACEDAILFDAELDVRGYPVRETGFYVREPIFAEIVREALRLGFRLVAYEPTDPAIQTMEDREEGQAKNLACIFTQDPAAKLLVIAGFSHISKSLDTSVPGGWMAARFKAMTGVDPLTVDTTTLLRARADAFRFGKGMKEHPSQAYVLFDANGHLYSSDAYDLILLLPGVEGRHGAGRSWLELDGMRQRKAISLDGCGHARPCLVEAFLIDEESGIPADSCVVEDEQRECYLFLPDGEFKVRYSDDSLRELNSLVVSSD